ncbi:phage tail assembly protein [Derxia gummosa]|uniref:Phage tail assembly protein n=1 Tax=Derxia gummosa DSM 723 TaxID=1121388 RepID=A0A8B6XD90_9BURK|nr:phage tail assembly protein [Derxia gummosa]
MSNKTIIPLESPVTIGDDTITELSLRRPSGKDVRELGFPYRLTAIGDVAIDAGIACKYASRLAAVPPSTIDALDPVDISTLAQTVLGFFMASAAPTPTSPQGS